MTALCSSSCTLGPSLQYQPLFCPVMLCLRLYVCDSHFCMPSVSGFQHLGTGCWNQSIFSLSEASLPITGHSCLPGMSAFLLLFLALSWGGFLIGVETSCRQLITFSPAWPSQSRTSSQTYKRVTHSLQTQKQAQQGYVCPRVPTRWWGKQAITLTTQQQEQAANCQHLLFCFLLLFQQLLFGLFLKFKGKGHTSLPDIDWNLQFLQCHTFYKALHSQSGETFRNQVI